MCQTANDFVALNAANIAGGFLHQLHLHPFLTTPFSSKVTLLMWGQSQILLMRPMNYDLLIIVHIISTASSDSDMLLAIMIGPVSALLDLFRLT